MKGEYDFSGGRRGIFFRPNAQFNTPNEGRQGGSDDVLAVWTNVSVRKLAGPADPVRAVTARARSVVARAIDQGWKGPPYDPIELAKLMGIRIQPSADVRDARTIAADRSDVLIEFNPNQPPRRIRYSVAHEVAHTFFPDFHESARHRHRRSEVSHDDWQLEALCNLAAAELLMPYGTMPSIEKTNFTVDNLLSLREQFQVSTEAMLIRATNMAHFPCAMICAHRIEDGEHSGEYQLDYSILSGRFGQKLRRDTRFSADSIIGECVAIGYTSKGALDLEGQPYHFECVGIPPYPGSSYPRVAAILIPLAFVPDESGGIDYLVGSALEPRGKGPKVIAHVVNNKTANWGGGGFAAALKRKWPIAQQEFRDWALQRKISESLGDVCITRVADDIWVLSMVAQVGFGPSKTPRIRYAALRECLEKVAGFAAVNSAAIHIPRIGCGLAGGKWEIIEELVADSISDWHLDVTVYDLPRPAQQGTTLTLI